MPETTTDRIGDYELLEAIGEGAEGRVYKARCIRPGSSGEPVALKRLRSSGADKETLLFKRQTEILSKLNHPNIIRYVDSFVWREEELGEEVFCLVTELLEGQSVKVLLESHPKGLPWAQASGILFQTLSALQFASKLKVVHRDLKLSNLYITRQGSIKIIDFGIARNEDSGATTTAASGNIKGTYDYMAPDFVHQQGIFRGDEQSDIFSFGVCLYQVLTGNLPFPAFSGNQLIGYVSRWHAPKPPEPDFRHTVFSVLSHAANCIRKCLAVDRAARYRTFDEVMADFSNIKPRTLRHGSEVYEYLEYLGKGGFGRVFRARRTRDGFDTAIKEMLADRGASRFVREAKILQSARHPNLVQYLDFVEVEEQRMGDQRRLFLVLEYLKGMPAAGLRDRIRSTESGMDPQEVLTLFAGYLDCLEHMHKRGIIHRDIKPGNLYAPEGDPAAGKIFDLGIAHDTEGTKTHGQVPGTLDYMPPEFATQSSDRGSAQSDIYSMGVTLYQSLTKKLPFPRLPEKEADAWLAFYQRSEKPLDCSFEHPVFKVHPELVKLVRRSLALDPKQRYPSAAAMREEMLGILDLWEKKAAFDAAMAAAHAAVEAEDYEEAERHAKRAVELMPKDVVAATLLKKARASLLEKEFSAALQRGKNAFLQGDYAEAEHQAGEALRLRPRDREAAELLAHAQEAARKARAAASTTGEESTAFFAREEAPPEDATAATLPADLEIIKRELERAEAQHRAETEVIAREQAAREQAEREKQAQAEREQAERARQAQAERERIEKEKREQEAKAKAERERLEAVEKEKLEQARRQREEHAKAEAAKRAELEKARLEQARREAAEKEEQEQLRSVQAEKERAERAKREQEERQKQEQARREQAERDRIERERREQAEKEAREQAERERAEREALERQRREEEEAEEQRLAEERRAAHEARMAELKPRIAKALKLAAVLVAVLGLAVGGYFGWQSYAKAKAIRDEASFKGLLQAAQTALANSEFETARDRASEALRFKPGDAEASKVKEDAIAKLTEKKASEEREEKYQTAVKDAQAAIDAKDWPKATTKVQEALALKPDGSEAKQLQKTAVAGSNAAKSTQEREQTYQNTVKAGQTLFDKGDFSGAVTKANDALALKSNGAEAAQLRRDAQAKLDGLKAAQERDQKYAAAVKAGQDLFDKRDFAGALAKANDALGFKADGAEAAQLKQKAQAAQESEQKYQAAVQAGQTLLGKQEYAGAIAKADEALALKPGGTEATKLKQNAQGKINDARAAKEREQKYQDAIKAAQDALKNKDYAKARTQAEAALALKPNDPTATKLKTQTVELPELAKAEDLFKGGDLPGAKDVVGKHSDSDFFKTLEGEIQAEQSALTRAQEKFKSGDYSFMDDVKSQPYAKKPPFASLLADGQKEQQMLSSFESVKATNGWAVLQRLLADPGAASVRDKTPFKALRAWADGEAQKVADAQRGAIAQRDANLEQLLDSFDIPVPPAFRSPGGRKVKRLGAISLDDIDRYLGLVAKLESDYNAFGVLGQNNRGGLIKDLRSKINKWE